MPGGRESVGEIDGLTVTHNDLAATHDLPSIRVDHVGRPPRNNFGRVIRGNFQIRSRGIGAVPELAISGDTDVIQLPPDAAQRHTRRAASLTQMITNQQDAPTCPNCGNVVVRNGACYKCLNCGESLGCS